jgi:hypothetical protein
MLDVRDSAIRYLNPSWKDLLIDNIDDVSCYFKSCGHEH